MAKFSSNIEIDKNSICYGNEILKISNISRTWIFRFQNKEKKAHDIEKLKYEEAKKQYESMEQWNKNSWIKRYTIACIITGIFSIYLLETTLWGLLLSAISAICGFLAVKKYRKDIKYDKAPPEEKEFPNKFGLGIEMNSGYVAIFAAEGEKGVHALKKLQNDIKDADAHNAKTIFNMNEYNVKVEGDVEGIVNFGDDSVNVNQNKEQLDI